MAARVIAAALIAVAAGQEALSLDDECAGEEQCALNALQRRGEAVSALEKTAEAAGAPKCESLQHPSNNICRSTVEWAHRGGKYDRHGPQWFADMQSISGVDYHTASLGDWQKLYFCAPPGGKQCGSPPCTCTHPPCDVCFQGKSKAKCSDPDSIACKPPATALDYNGMAWEDMNLLVASSFKSRAAKVDPVFILNVGDNFYWGGIEKTCGTPMDELSYVTHHQFDQVFENIYNGPGLDGKPWLSVLGNHDWGGRVFNNGWDQQIAYTWHSDRWRLPAAYWSQHVNFVDAGFTMDIFMVDSNSQDAEDPPLDPEHNICGSAHNPPGANCASQGGPTSVATCKAWFWALWRKNQEWLTEQLSKSTADWQLAVTHFPCGFEKNYW
ncbi:ACP5, partial [Symbiodinium microadriaticum]